MDFSFLGWLKLEPAYRNRQGFAVDLNRMAKEVQLAIENLLAKHWSLLIRFGDVCATQ
jgi:hypothetical protein